MRHLIALFCMVLLPALVAGTAGNAQKSEVIEVPSRNLTDAQFLAGDATAGRPVMLSGRLRLLEGEPPNAVVILLHGSDGPSDPSVGQWQWTLRRVGVATFRLDCFTGRGITEVASNQSSLGSLNQIYDAYRAVEVLAAHPGIDPDRIALMGFGRGATTALYAAMTRFQASFGPQRGRIAAHLPVSPACNFAFVGETDVTDAPIREFHGGADDFTPAGPCREYIARLAAAGHDVSMTEYPGAGHNFDTRSVGSWSDASLATSRKCNRVERDGILVSESTGQPFTWDDACVERGVSGGYSETAAADAEAAVAALLRDTFALP